MGLAFGLPLAIQHRVGSDKLQIFSPSIFGWIDSIDHSCNSSVSSHAVEKGLKSLANMYRVQREFFQRNSEFPKP